jgi:hypothetical protein
MKKILLSALIAAFLYSCSTVTKITNSNINEMATHESGIVMRPLLADLEVSQERKSIEYSVPYYMHSKKEGKENSLLQFKKTHNCDYVIDPVFEIIIKTGKDKERKIIVNGYAASYSNIRQVDTLPESIIQYGLLPKNVKSLDYLNTFEEKIPTKGVEISYIDYSGIQYDQLIGNSNNRFYLSGDFYGLFNDPRGQLEFQFRDKSNNDIIGKQITSFDSRFALSGGLMKEFPVSNSLKFRLQGGVNFMTGKTNINNVVTKNPYFVSSSGDEDKRFLSLGLRLGAGIDQKIYKSLSLIFKVHYNQNLLNNLSAADGSIEISASEDGTTEVVEYKNRKIRFDDISTLNLSAGLRIAF